MQVTDILRIVRRRGWIVLLLIALTAGAAFGFSRTQTTLYRSTIAVRINTARPDWSLSQSAKLLLVNYTLHIYTEKIAADVIDKLQLDKDPAALKDMVAVDPDEYSLSITISVKDPDCKVANAVAATWAQELVDWRNVENAQNDKVDRIGAEILDQPKCELYQPQTKVNVAAGAILGLLLGGALVFALEWVESGIVRSPADLERFVGVTALGAIPHPRTRPTQTPRRPA